MQNGLIPKRLLKDLIKDFANYEKNPDGLTKYYYKVSSAIKPTFFEIIEKEKIKENVQKEIVLSELFMK